MYDRTGTEETYNVPFLKKKRLFEREAFGKAELNYGNALAGTWETSKLHYSFWKK